ncbi:MAG TPA: hypothetical protein VGD30_15175 [Telluria sp.]
MLLPFQERLLAWLLELALLLAWLQELQLLLLAWLLAWLLA